MMRLSLFSLVCVGSLGASVLTGCGDSPAAGDAGMDGSIDAIGTDAGGPDAARAAGALIGVTMNSTVAFLLEDFPSASRDRIAAEVTARPMSFWVARAQQQIRLTTLRLIYRNTFYPPEENRFSLPLPAQDVGEVTPMGAATRRVIDGHDVIAVDYAFRTTILTDEASPAASEPMLAAVGGTYTENFEFPADPTLLLQRTGYACVDEDQFPTGSVNAENAWLFYDHMCEAETPDMITCHVTESGGTESCSAALTRVTGHVSAPMRFERLAFNTALADRVRRGTVTTPDAPDLAVIATGPLSLSTNYLVYRYIPATHCAVVERCVGGAGWRRLLTFDSHDQNQGGRPLHIGPVDYSVEGLGSELIEHHAYELSACHNHYHFRYYGDFSFGASTGPGRVQKNGFCIESTDRISNNESSPTHTPYDCHNQGVSAGWGDLYSAGLVCNWVDVTGVSTSAGPVTNNLSFHSNPDGFMCEGTLLRDAAGAQRWETTSFRTERGEPVGRPMCTQSPGTEANDLGTVPVTLPQRGGMMSSACTDAQSIGPGRNCGFTMQTAMPTCTPGAMVTLQCSGGTAAAPQVVRVCETSRVLGTGVDCSRREALANEVNANGMTAVTFRCPAMRDAMEPGGQYAIYAAPAFNADSAMPVTCR